MSHTITAVLIDDERKALAILKNKIERMCPNVNIIGETQDPVEGLELIKSLEPQLVFLDVAMPEMSGFDLLKHFSNPTFEVIFATAFDNYAIDAIKHCAIGYLIKPIDNTDLKTAVENAVQSLEEKTALKKNKLLIANLGVKTFQDKKIVIPCQDGLEFVKIADIVNCEGVDGYTKVCFANRKSILSSNSIKYFFELLEDKGFYLVHKSHLINLDYIEKYLNEGYVILSSGDQVPVSRNRRQDFLSSIK